MFISFCERKVRRYVNGMFCTRKMYRYGFFLLATYTILMWIHYRGKSKNVSYQQYKDRMHLRHPAVPAAHGHVFNRLRALLPIHLNDHRYNDGMPFYITEKKAKDFLYKHRSPWGKFIDLTVSNKAPRPVIIMASSRSYFPRTLKTIASVQSHLPNEKIVLYDIGLTRVQHRLASKICQVELRKFKFSDYPSYFRLLKTFAWKPIILQSTLQEFGAIMWLEAPIFITANEAKYTKAIEEAKKTGIMLLGGRAVSSVHHYTHPYMLRYLPLREIKHGFTFQSRVAPMIVYNTKQVHEHVMKWLVFCAFDRRCIAPPGAKQRYCRFRYKMDRIKKLIRIIRHCHHFDQSATNILLKNMFSSNPRAFISKTKISVLMREKLLRSYKAKLCKK